MRDPVTEGRYLQQHYARSVRLAHCASGASSQGPLPRHMVAALRCRLGAAMIGLGQQLLGTGAQARGRASFPGLQSIERSLPRPRSAFVPAGILAWQTTRDALPDVGVSSLVQQESWYMAVVFRCEPGQAALCQVPLPER